MDAHDAWVDSVQQKLKGKKFRCDNLQWCIYRVPAWLKDHVCDGNDKTPYVPEMISFGPYHWGTPELVEMEKHKWRCLQTMLTRERQNVEVYLKELRIIQDDARACYEGPLNDDLNNNAFVEMLLLDGCFMLEFLSISKSGLMRSQNYGKDDPIFSKRAIMHVIGRDMMKLENQIPVFVLEKILSPQFSINKKHIPKLVLHALSPLWVTNEILSDEQFKTMKNAVASGPNNKMLHCLDIFRSSLLYKPEKDKELVEISNEVAAYPNNKMLHCLNSLCSSFCWYKPSSASEDQRFERGEPMVEMGGIASPSHSRTHTQENDIESLVQEEQHDLEIDQLSVQDDRPSTLCDKFGEDDQYWRGPISYVSSSNTIIPEEQNPDTENMRHTCFLDVINKVINCGRRPKPSTRIVAKSELMVYCVGDLREAGVKLKVRPSKAFWDLNFDERRGLLKIPPIKIDDATKTVFLNLIAYEQCHLRYFREMHITDYVAFMDKLVSSGADVGHLHQAGIIVHGLGSDNEVADLLNRLVKKAFVDWGQGELSDVYEQLNKYCTHRRHRWCANLRHDYLTNPWVIFSIIAAVILFLLTLTQTFYASFAYHNPPK